MATCFPYHKKEKRCRNKLSVKHKIRWCFIKEGKKKKSAWNEKINWKRDKNDGCSIKSSRAQNNQHALNFKSGAWKWRVLRLWSVAFTTRAKHASAIREACCDALVNRRHRQKYQFFRHRHFTTISVNLLAFVFLPPFS